ncbi:MAG: DUF417 family protein [Scandinavium sp.]|uniref:hypothetical protein n=1 Tax=Scandinavium sp. TaxID=2830653 RepID=UPI003F3A1AF1
MKLNKPSSVLYRHEMNLVRVTVVLLFFIYGNLKWFAPEMHLVDTLTHETWLSFLPRWLGQDGTSYFLAVVQAAISVALLGGIVFPVLGITGGLAAIASALITLNLLPAAMSESVIGLALKEILLASAAAAIVYFDFRVFFQQRLVIIE